MGTIVPDLGATMKIQDRLDELIKSVEVYVADRNEELEKISAQPRSQRVNKPLSGPTGASVKVYSAKEKQEFAAKPPEKKTQLIGERQYTVPKKDEAKKVNDTEGKEALMKPPVSEAQRKAMHAAAAGKSTLDIPKSVGKEFADADKGGKLPEKKKKDKSEKADDLDKEQGHLGEYWKQKPKKVPESQQGLWTKPQGRKDPSFTPPKVNAPSGGVKRQEASPSASSAKVGGQKRQAGLVPPKPKTALEVIQDRQKLGKSYEEIVGSADTLSKAEKDELFPDAKMSGVPAQIEPWTPDKQSCAESIYHLITCMSEMRSKTYDVAQRTPEAVKALEYLYDHKKDELKDHVKKFKDAKPRKELSKSEVYSRVSGESLTKSIRSQHTDTEIDAMLIAAVNAGALHRNVLLEWNNYRTINPIVVELAKR